MRLTMIHKKIPSIEFTSTTKITEICDALSIGCFFYKPESCFVLVDSVDGNLDIIGRFSEYFTSLSLNGEPVNTGATVYRDPISKKISFYNEKVN